MLSHGRRHDGSRELLGDEGVSRGLTWGGAVVVALGVLFTLQGLGLVGGSAMTGSTTWVLLGPVIAAIGAVLVVAGARRRARGARR